MTSILIALILGFALLFSGLAKLDAPRAFLQAVLGYRLVTPFVAVAIAFVLPMVELVSGAGLMLRRTRRSSAWIALGLGLMFTVAQLGAWARGLDIACGCFEFAGRERIGWGSVARSLGVVVGSSLLLLKPTGDGSERQPASSGKCAVVE
jgi:uncharacterized membrane protein